MPRDWRWEQTDVPVQVLPAAITGRNDGSVNGGGDEILNLKDAHVPFSAGVDGSRHSRQARRPTNKGLEF